MKKIRFYNTFHSFDSDNVTYVWVPLSVDFKVYLDYFLKYNDSFSFVEVEDVFEEYVANNQKISFFQITNKLESNKNKTIVLYAQSDTLANSCYNIYKNVKGFHFVLMYPSYYDEGAKQFFDTHEVESIEFSVKRLRKLKPDLFIMLNDWSKTAKRVVNICRFYHIPNVCLQESIIDFGDHFKRMEYADNVFVQGIQTVFDLKRKSYFLTGNPRYEVEINQKSKDLKVLINSNFTYGIFEDIRDQWLDDIVSVLTKNNIDFKISQHPRDMGDLSRFGDKVLESNSKRVSQQIEMSDVIITRFSSLIHESVLKGKNVVYYNPHNEKMNYNFRFNESFLSLCKNTDELNSYFSHLPLSDQEEINDYITNHITPMHSKVNQNLSELFENYKFRNHNKVNFIHLFLYLPFVLKLAKKVKKRV